MPSSGMLHFVALIRKDVVPSSPILDTLMMEALGSSETWVPTRATRRNIPEDGILLSSCCFANDYFEISAQQRMHI
jgi:hypothetical protein